MWSGWDARIQVKLLLNYKVALGLGVGIQVTIWVFEQVFFGYRRTVPIDLPSGR